MTHLFVGQASLPLRWQNGFISDSGRSKNLAFLIVSYEVYQYLAD